MRIDLDKFPVRQQGMKPFEILLSESQERMIVVVKKGREDEVQRIFGKWDLDSVRIGEVTEGGRLEYFYGGELVADVPAESLVLGGGAPVYEREYSEPAYFRKAGEFDITSVAQAKDLKVVGQFLLSLPSIASKRWITEQYDSTVGTVNMSTNMACEAGIVNLKGIDRALALTVDCNARYVYLDPEKGASIAVAEAARNIVCSGGQPCGITNCLNFGNPYNKEVFWQFTGAIKGLKSACEKFSTPVTGGNVSFYNQSQNGSGEEAVHPTPTIGMVGIVRSKAHITPMSFNKTGDQIYMLGKARNDISGSDYLFRFHGVKLSPAPYVDLDEELKLQKSVLSAIESGLLSSAHDCSEGGLFVALFESASVKGLGCEISSDTGVRKDAFLFGESQGRIVVTVRPEKTAELEKLLNSAGQQFCKLGVVVGSEMIIDGENFGSVTSLKKIYDNAIGEIMK